MPKEKKIYGLIGKNIDYSFSKKFFTEKFLKLNIENSCQYINFDIDNLDGFADLLNKPNIKGLNVTIPYKESILKYLDEIDREAQKIGAINTIKIDSKGKSIGFNTDYIGFKYSIQKFLKKYHKKALILGSGGASKAIIFALDELKIERTIASRTDKIGYITYEKIDSQIIKNHQIIVNCTPLGTYPNVNACPELPYNFLTEKHLCFDLIYNPKKTKFLKMSEKNKSKIVNGYEMLEIQAEESWRIWNY